MITVASISPLQVIKLFPSWDEMLAYRNKNIDYFISASSFLTVEEAERFANEMRDMTPEWSLELL